MDTNHCIRCETRKPITEFRKRMINGVDKLRNVCKECQNSDERERQAEKKEGANTVQTKAKKSPTKQIEAPAPIMENQVEFTAPMEKIQSIRSNAANQFTDDEVRQIRELLNNSNKFIEVHVSYEVPETQKGQRKPKTYNLNPELTEWIDQEAKKHGISASNIVSAIIYKARSNS